MEGNLCGGIYYKYAFQIGTVVECRKWLRCHSVLPSRDQADKQKIGTLVALE